MQHNLVLLTVQELTDLAPQCPGHSAQQTSTPLPIPDLVWAAWAIEPVAVLGRETHVAVRKLTQTATPPPTRAAHTHTSHIKLDRHPTKQQTDLKAQIRAQIRALPHVHDPWLWLQTNEPAHTHQRHFKFEHELEDEHDPDHLRGTSNQWDPQLHCTWTANTDRPTALQTYAWHTDEHGNTEFYKQSLHLAAARYGTANRACNHTDRHALDTLELQSHPPHLQAIVRQALATHCAEGTAHTLHDDLRSVRGLLLAAS